MPNHQITLPAHALARMVFSVEQVLKLIPDGKFPAANGFAWEEVDHFRLEDGCFEPYGGFGDILPGPSLRVTVEEVPLW